MSVYLLHFAGKYKHAGHYLGYASCVERRVKQHQCGAGVPLTRAACDVGISLLLVRVWPDGDKGLEKQLRQQNNNPRLCPLCSASSTQRVQPSMETSIKKPTTHCDKYGHSWVASPFDGFEMCSNCDYRNNKLVPCPAIREKATGIVSDASPGKQQDKTPPVPQQTLWEG